MEGIGQFDQNEGDAVPRYDRHGRLLTEDQRRQIAERRGVCVKCGTQTHARKSALRRKALTNENVYEGICIRCNQRRVPPHIFNAWDAKNKPIMSATVTPIHHAGSSSGGGMGGSSQLSGLGASGSIGGGSRRVGPGGGPAPSPSQSRFPGRPGPGHNRGASTGSAGGSGNHSRLAQSAYQGAQRSVHHPPNGGQYTQAGSMAARTFPIESSGSSGALASPTPSLMSRGSSSSHQQLMQQQQQNRMQSSQGHLQQGSQNQLVPPPPAHGRTDSHGSLSRSGHDGSRHERSPSNLSMGDSQQQGMVYHGNSMGRGLDAPPSNYSNRSVNADTSSSMNKPATIVEGASQQQHKNDSQRSMGSVLTASTSESGGGTPSNRNMHLDSMADQSEHSNDGGGEEVTTTPLEDEKAALGFKRTAPATRPGVQSVTSSNESSAEFTPPPAPPAEPEEVQQPKTYFENEKAALGIVRTPPATRPGVQSYSSATSMDAAATAEPSSVVKTTSGPVDEKANYRQAPASRPGVQSVSSRSVVSSTGSNRSDHEMRLGQSSDNENETSAERLRESMSGAQMRGSLDSSTTPMSKSFGSADLKLSLQDNYKGDETKLSTDDYIQQLGENLEDPIKLRLVLHNLRNIEDEDQGEALHALKEIISHMATDPRVGDVAAGVVWRTAATNDDAKTEVMQSGAVDALMDCLRQNEGDSGDDHEFCQWALGVLTSVSFVMENKEIIADKGGVELVLRVLSRQKKHAGVLEWACRCLHNLVFCYQQDGAFVDQAVLVKNITSIEEAGGIDIITDAMSQNSTENNAQLWAVKLLWRLLGGEKASDSKRRIGVMHRVVVIRKLAAADFISVASKLLRQQSTLGELQHLTAELMTVVLLGSGGDSNKLKFALLLEKASQCVPNMIRSMQQLPDDLEVQAAGCRLLSTLCDSSGEIPVFLIDQGAVDAIASAMVKLRDNVSIIEAGVWGLWKLSAEWRGSSDEIVLDQSTIRHVLGVIKDVTAGHSDEEVQRGMNGFAINVCGVDGVTESDFPISDLADGFYAFPKAGGAEILTLLCTEYPESSVMVLQSLDLTRVVTILNENRSSDVQESLVPIMVAAADNSASARDVMISSGVLSAAVAVLQSTQDKDKCMSLLGLIAKLSGSGPINDGGVPPQMPQGFCRTIEACLQNFGTDEESCVRVLQSATAMIVQSAPAEESCSLLPWVTEKLGSPSTSVSLRVECCEVVWAIASKGQITDPSLLRDLLQNILAVMVQFNGDNGQGLNLEIESAAAGALGGLASCIRSCPIPVEPNQIDSFMGAVYKARPLGEAARTFMIRILVAIWHLCFVHEGVLLQSGVIILVMDIMGAYKEDAEIQEKCCSVLAQLASSENIQITLSIVETDGVAMLLSSLGDFPSNLGVQSEAAKALSHLSTDDETRMLVNAMGGIGLLVSSITSFNNDLTLLERAYSALLNLTSDAPEQFLDFSAIVRAIVSTMASYPHSSGLRENGLGILQNVCMKGPAAKETIAAEGGINTVTTAMEKFITTPTVLERSFSTLWSLAVLPANQNRIAQANGIEMVVSGMLASIEYERVQQQGCGCMFTLALDPNNRMSFRDVGGVDAVTLSSKAHFGSAAVQAEVCKCLAGLSTPGEGRYQVRSISQDEVDAVVFAMQRFPHEEGVQVHGSSALLNFLFAKNASLVVSANKDMMIEAMQQASNMFHAQCSAVARDFNMRVQEF